MIEKADTRERILLAAKKEFAEKGFNGARMGAIAKRAKANQALIHYYFESKEKLYIEVLHRLFGIDRADEIRGELQNWNLPTDQALYAAIYLLVNIHLEATDPDLNRIIAREITEEHRNLTRIIQEYLIPRLNAIEDVIKKGVDEGIFSTENTLLVVNQMVTFVLSYENGKVHYLNTDWHHRLYGDGYKEKLISFLVSHTFKGLTPEGKKIKIPTIPDSIKVNIDKIVESVKSRQLWISEEHYEKQN